MQNTDTRDAPDRSQSEVLGVVLLVGIAVVGAVAVALVGTSALDADRERVASEQAERSLSEFDSRASGVALGRADGTRVDLGLPDSEGTTSVRSTEGWMRIRFTDLTGLRDPNSVEVTNVTLGSVVFQQDGRTVGYQAGGVFRSQGSGSVLVSRPEFHYRNGTLTVPIIRTQGQSGVASVLQVTPDGTTRVFPDASRNLTNKVDNTSVVVTVRSRYYQAWGDFFRQYTNGIVTVSDTDRTATVQFISLPDGDGIGGGIIATAEGGDLELAGTGAYVDSYNSSNGPYTSTKSTDGEVKAVGNVVISADATIDGNTRAGKDVRVEQSASLITGDARYTENIVNDGTIEGTVEQIDGVPTVLPIDTLVRDRLNEIRDSNDNDAVSELDDSRLTVSAGETVTLTNGSYYTDRIDVEAGELILDTSDGNITLAVEDWIRVAKKGSDGGEITVEGDGVVKVYLTSQSQFRASFTGAGQAPDRNVNLFVDTNSSVTVPGDESPRFQVFGPQITDVAIAGSNSGPATFTGLVYAPDGLDQNGVIYAKQANVYGGLVAGKITLGQNGRVHYDKALADLELPRASRVSRLEYMHVAIHRMNVTAT